MFSIRRRRTKIIEKLLQVDDVETAKDALEDLKIESKSLEAIVQHCPESGTLKTKNKIKYALFILFGITGCYLSFKFIPMYFVSVNLHKIKIDNNY